VVIHRDPGMARTRVSASRWTCFANDRAAPRRRGVRRPRGTAWRENPLSAAWSEEQEKEEEKEGTNQSADSDLSQRIQKDH
jgi:hypothetical protein